MTEQTHRLVFQNIRPDEATSENPLIAQLSFPYDPELVNEVKQTFRSRRYDADHRAWNVAIGSRHDLSRLGAFLTRHPEFEASHSLIDPVIESTVDGIEAREPEVEARRLERAKDSFSVEQRPDALLLAFEYHAPWIEAIRQLPKDSRQFDANERLWLVERKEAVIRTLIDAGEKADFPDSALDSLKRAIESDQDQESGRRSSSSGAGASAPAGTTNGPSEHEKGDVAHDTASPDPSPDHAPSTGATRSGPSL